MNTQGVLHNPMVGRSLAFKQSVHPPPAHQKLGGNLVKRTPAERHESIDNPLHLLDETQVIQAGDCLQVFFKQGKFPGVGAGNFPFEVQGREIQGYTFCIKLGDTTEIFLVWAYIVRSTMRQLD